MLETPHVIVGAAIATKVGNPLLAFPLAIASHFVLDKIPHWNPHTYTETVKNGGPSRATITIAVVDVVVSLAVGIGIAATVLPNTSLAITILACCFASAAPDISKYPFFLFKKLRKGIYQKWVKFERTLQVQTDNLFWGLLTQVVVSLAAIWWII